MRSRCRPRARCGRCRTSWSPRTCRGRRGVGGGGRGHLRRQRLEVRARRAAAEPGRHGRAGSGSVDSVPGVAERVIEVAGLRKSYGDVEAVRRHRPVTSTRARCSRSSVRTAPARRRPSRSSRATGSARAGEVSVLGSRPRAARARALRAPDRHRPAVDRRRSVPDGARDHRHVRRLLPVATLDVDEVIELVGLTEKRDTRVNKLSGGQQRRLDVAIAPRRRPRAPVPGRADDGVRPERAPQRVGDREEPHGARQDGVPHDALHGRGAVPGGPRRP